MAEAKRFMGVQLSQSEYAQLDSLARQNGLSKAAVLRLGLRQIILSSVADDNEFKKFPSVRLYLEPEPTEG